MFCCVEEDDSGCNVGLEESKRDGDNWLTPPSLPSAYQIYMGAKYIKGHHDQDFATYGSGSNFHYVIVADGHGPRGNVVKLLKRVDWEDLLSNYHNADDILNEINSYIADAKISDIRDGSTLSIVKILPNEGKIHAYWIGDSQLVIRKTNVVHSDATSTSMSTQRDIEVMEIDDPSEEHTGTVSSTIYNTNPSSDFLVGEGGEIDDDEIEVEEIIPNDDATTTSHTTATTTTSYNNNNDRTNPMNMNTNQNDSNE